MQPQEQVLYSKVYLPAFVKACAARGLAINDQASLNTALETAALVDQHLNAQTGGVLKQANAALKAALGVPQLQKKAALTKQMADTVKQLCADPSVVQAALTA